MTKQPMVEIHEEGLEQLGQVERDGALAGGTGTSEDIAERVHPRGNGELDDGAAERGSEKLGEVLGW